MKTRYNENEELFKCIYDIISRILSYKNVTILICQSEISDYCTDVFVRSPDNMTTGYTRLETKTYMFKSVIDVTKIIRSVLNKLTDTLDINVVNWWCKKKTLRHLEFNDNSLFDTFELRNNEYKLNGLQFIITQNRTYESNGIAKASNPVEITHTLNFNSNELDQFLYYNIPIKDTTPYSSTPLANTNYHSNLVQKLTYILSNIQPKFISEDIINAVKTTYKNDPTFVTYIRLLYSLACKKPKMATVQGNNLLKILFTTDNKATKEELEVYINLIVLILNSTDTTSILYRQNIKNMFKKLQESVAYESIKLNNVTNYIDLIEIFYKYDITLINMTPGMETEDFNKVLDIYLKSKCYKIYGVLKTALDNIDYEHISKINDTKFLVDVLQNKLIYPQISQLEQLKPLAHRITVLFDTLTTNNLLLNLLVNNEPEFVDKILTLYANRDASPFETSYKFNDIIEILPALTPICLKNKVLTQELVSKKHY